MSINSPLAIYWSSGSLITFVHGMLGSRSGEGPITLDRGKAFDFTSFLSSLCEQWAGG